MTSNLGTAILMGPTPVLDDAPSEKRHEVMMRALVIALIAFLTLIDLFGSQALLPTLVAHYQVSPATMGFAVNASTFGMAIAGLCVALFSNRIDRKLGIWLSLTLLAIPTFLLGLTDDLTTFALLRVVQGFFMAAAFTLTLTYLSEICTVTAASGAMAAYITGNVASNLFGRLLAAGVADNIGLAESFYAFAALNLAGAGLAIWYFGLRDGSRPEQQAGGMSVWQAWADHFANPKLRASFAIGFIILFAFVGTFTYVNFVLAEDPFELPQAYIGLIYFVFLPSMLTTPIAGGIARKYGARAVFWASILVSMAGLLMLLTPSLVLVLVGLALIGVGLFFGQAAATGYVGRTATHSHAAANGLYLTSYYVGGLAGAFLLGQLFVFAGWLAVVLFLLAVLAAALVLGRDLKEAT
ncbi:MFS transporter [Pseudovibrio sp. SPO723]|uniref:MFS transporter n=1 Tax=Nesiotobacter zosterae TaxID=392721 RepID=UPI0029C2262C|nr:MFS transporter [Pseudovibrio sp. SPO723]MDX5593983.1 MFS transporter [Pseudovibrio sp. SPO723]